MVGHQDTGVYEIQTYITNRCRAPTVWITLSKLWNINDS